MPVTRNRNPDRSINEEKQDLPDDGEDPVDGEDSYEGEEPSDVVEEESYFPAKEDVKDDVIAAQNLDGEDPTGYYYRPH